VLRENWRGICPDDAQESYATEIKTISMAERVGFEALNADLCIALHGLVRARETKHLSQFLFPRDLIDVF
jgi:hypothetical protein